MRRSKEADKKKTAKLIKTSLTELGYTEDQLHAEFLKGKRGDPFFSDLVKLEAKGEKILKTDLEKISVYSKFLTNVKGLGVLTSAQLIAIVGDITRFPNPSKLQSYLGIGNPLEQKRENGKTNNWNHEAKSLLLGVIADNLIKQKSPRKKIYDARKLQTLTTHPEWHNLNPDGTKNTGKNMNPKHADRDARRVMMQQFIIEFWRESYLAIGQTPPS